MRDRRPLLSHNYHEDNGADAVVDAKYDKLNARLRERRLPREASPRASVKEIIGRILFFVVVLGIPLMIIQRNTPFFVLERLRCRMMDKLWGDSVGRSLEEGYHRYHAEPPSFPSRTYNDTMLWGTYEPGLLFAMKTRTPRPVYVGVAWYDEMGLFPVRLRMTDILAFDRRSSDDEFISDERSSNIEVTWAVHDGVHYGREVVNDHANHASITLEFLKSPSGGSWHVRVHGELYGEHPLTLVVYILNEAGDVIEPDSMDEATGTGEFVPQVRSSFDDVEGRREAFALSLRDTHGPLTSPQQWQVHGWQTAEGTFLRDADLRHPPDTAHAYLRETGPNHWLLPPRGAAVHNAVVFRKAFSTDFRVELSMRHASHLAAGGFDATARQSFSAAYEALTSCQLTNAFRLREKSVLHRMRQLVSPWAIGFSHHRKLYVNRARTLLSAMLGSWGSWSGRYVYVDPTIDAAWDEQGHAVDRWSDAQLRESSYEAAAIGAVPSRIAGPYGDAVLTGLQLLTLAQWNREMAKEAIAAWLVGAQDDTTGFVPRWATMETFARTLTLSEERYEHVTFAAPPTLLLGLPHLLQRNERNFLETILPPLRRWRDWFHATQGYDVSGHNIGSGNGHNSNHDWTPDKRENRGNVTTLHGSLEALATAGGPAPRYRWRSRDGHRIMASGMPDYPRPTCAGEHRLEAHVDLFSWIALLSITVSEVEEMLGQRESVPRGVWRRWLDEVHWDADKQRYADRLGCPDAPFSTYVGYANLYPLLLGLIDDAERAKTVLELAASQLMTPHGLMSVCYESVREAREAKLSHDNRWMGHIWISTNAIMQHALRTKYIALLGSPAQELFTRVRQRVVESAGKVATMPEALNPVTGASESIHSLVGHRALLLNILESAQ